MVTQARGLVCLSLTRERCAALQLRADGERQPFAAPHQLHGQRSRPPRASPPASPRYDRAHTIRTAVRADARPQDLHQPGHVFPLHGPARRRADARRPHRGGGRPGALAGLEPAGVLVEILNDDGSMARRPELEVFAARHGLRIGSIADLIRHRLATEHTVRAGHDQREIDTAHGPFRLVTYRDDIDGALHFALVRGEPGRGRADAGARARGQRAVRRAAVAARRHRRAGRRRRWRRSRPRGAASWWWSTSRRVPTPCSRACSEPAGAAAGVDARMAPQRRRRADPARPRRAAPARARHAAPLDRPRGLRTRGGRIRRLPWPRLNSSATCRRSTSRASASARRMPPRRRARAWPWSPRATTRRWSNALVDGALATLADAGIAPERTLLVRVPGAWELPHAALALAERGAADAIVALGCVIRGETRHYDRSSTSGARPDAGGARPPACRSPTACSPGGRRPGRGARRRQPTATRARRPRRSRWRCAQLLARLDRDRSA